MIIRFSLIHARPTLNIQAQIYTFTHLNLIDAHFELINNPPVKFA